MRVAIVSKTFVADVYQRQLEWIARQPGVELTLITPTEWHSDDGRVLPFVPRYIAGYTVLPLPILFNGQYHFYVYRGLSQMMQRIRPDIVHIDEEPYNPAGGQAQRIADRIGARSVFVVLQNILRRYPFPYSALEQYNYRHTAHIIACNAPSGDVVRQKGYSGSLSTFSVYGIDPDLYPPRQRRERDTFVIGYVGRLVLYKGLSVLIEALSGLPANCQLRLLGSGPDEAELRRIATERGVADRVVFAGAVSSSEVPREIAAMDVMALPSLSRPNWKEQFGRALIEAMACEVPVVGSDSGEIPHVIGDAGLVTPEGDVEALRAALLKLATQPDLRETLARKGRERVLAHYTQEQVARKIVGVYHEALSTRIEHAETTSA